MKIDGEIKGEKLPYYINREAAKISALSCGKIYKYEYLTSKEILAPDPSRIREHAKFTYSPLSKTYEKQIKTLDDEEEKQIKALEEHEKKLNKYSDEKESLTYSKQIKFFEELANRRMEEIKYLLNDIKVLVFFGKNFEKKHLCCHDKNFYWL